MTGRVEGKVALVTGAARGQGRSHAVRLAEEGADVIAVDICADIESNPYPLGTEAELAETAAMVEKLDRRVVTVKADVRSREQLQAAVARGLAELGRLDVVVANAGILPMAMGDPKIMDFIDALDVDLVGVMNTVAAAMPHLGRGASIVITGSLAAMMPNTVDNPAMGPGSAGYGWSKRILMSYTEQLALQLGPHFIRANCVHPTNVDTQLLHNDGLYGMFRPDLENPTREDVEPAFASTQAIPVPYVQPRDISEAVLWLASDQAQYVTGMQLRVDAGAYLKYRSTSPTGL